MNRKTYTIKWLSDIHLNFYRNKEDRHDLYLKIKNGRFNCIVISGDIGESENFYELLEELQKVVNNKPIYFVLGNHDYYGSSVKDVRYTADELQLFVNERLTYLTNVNHQVLDRELGLCLVGVDGFADGRNGSGIDSYVKLNDQYYIEDLKEAYDKGYRPELFHKMQELADRDAEMLHYKLLNLPLWCTQVIVVTHIPPFEETSNYRGKRSSSEFLPFYTSKALSDVLLDFANKCPQVHITSLSGHTHGGGEAQILPNLVAKTHDSGYHDLKAKLIRFKQDV